MAGGGPGGWVREDQRRAAEGSGCEGTGTERLRGCGRGGGVGCGERGAGPRSCRGCAAERMGELGTCRRLPRLGWG